MEISVSYTLTIFLWWWVVQGVTRVSPDLPLALRTTIHHLLDISKVPVNYREQYYYLI